MSHRNRHAVVFMVSLIFVLGSCRPPVQTERTEVPQIVYTVKVSNPLDDIFRVTVKTAGLSADNGIYNFASTAPGTYSLLDFGRFVSAFKAFDGRGNEIPTEKISLNQWKISRPGELATITYDIEDSFDARVEANPVAPMCGSGIDSNYATFNTFAVLGYFEGLQSTPVKMKVEYQPGWIIATALDTDREGYYVAETFDRLADSPVLAGKLTVAKTKVNDIDVEVYVYAVDTTLGAQTILTMANDVLQSAGDFIGSSPVPYYKFLCVLLDGPTFQRYGLTSAGALEHSYSSLYVLPVSPAGIGQLQGIMAHEFMHILTPLNLHSEIIHSFNFTTPNPSEHLWLYEGVTEWVSDIMQLRSGLISTEQFLGQMTAKLNVNDNFDKDMSLSELGLSVYTEKGGSQFGNIYNKGAVTAALLDIRLLELSYGKRGLREVFLSLLNKYGNQRPFPEREFFDIVVKETYPQIRDFIDDYIRDSKELPYKEYFAKLGFRYVPRKPSEDTRPAIGVSISGDGQGHLVASSVGEEAKEYGLKDGDILVKLFGTELSFQNANEIFGRLSGMKVGDPYEVVVRRGDDELALQGKLVQRWTNHVFEDAGTITDMQEMLRQSWLKNL
ncbi:MAG: peptidase [Bacteroidota bacterium]